MLDVEHCDLKTQGLFSLPYVYIYIYIWVNYSDLSRGHPQMVV